MLGYDGMEKGLSFMMQNSFLSLLVSNWLDSPPQKH